MIPTAFTLALSAVVGAVFGSFIACALYRVPRGMSLRHPPSTCLSCNARLQIADLVPVLSWFFSGGRCRHCKARVSGRYALVEGVAAGLAVLACLTWGIGYALPFGIAGLLCLEFVVFLALFERKRAGKTLLAAIFLLIFSAVLP